MARLQQRLVGWPVAVAVLAALAAWAPAATARDADMCSTLNTGSGSANMSIFQTVGLCYDFCIGDYAYAVVNYQSCWCTNWEPAETTEVDMDECDRSCPGYPDEKCGGAKNRFGYIALGMAPSGTSSPPGASTKVVPPATTTVQQTVTIAPTSDAGSEPAASSPSAAPSSAVAGKPDPETTGGSSKTSATPTPTTAVTTDPGGLIRTVTATPVASTDLSNADGNGSDDNNSDDNNSDDNNSGDNNSDDNSSDANASAGLNTGQVVGIVLGVIGGVAVAAIAIVIFVVARRKKEQQMDAKGKGRAGDMGESSYFGSMFSPGSGPWRQSGPSAGSRLSEVDPRMDPFKPGLYARNSSHESFHTMRDEHDYSRPVHQPKVLRATNPDPDVE